MVTAFRGWRKKTGLITLLFACMFTAGWARSYLVEDSIWPGIPGTLVDGKRFHLAISSPIGLAWIKIEEFNPDNVSSWIAGWASRPLTGSNSSQNILAAYSMGANLRQWSNGMRLTIEASDSSNDVLAFFPNNEVIWRRQFVGFDIGSIIHRSEQCRISYWVIPYWFLSPPLVLVSFWLLLSKPCDPRKKQPIDVRSEEVT